MNRHHRLRTFIAFAATFVLGAAQCPPKANEVDAGVDGGSVFVGTDVETYCEFLTRCAEVWGVIASSKEVCVGHYRQVVDCPALGYVASAPNGERCRKLLATLDCNAPTKEIMAVCSQVVGLDEQVNLPKVNEPCTIYCAYGNYCEFSETGGFCGVCRPNIALGGACGTGQNYWGASCVDGAYCDYLTYQCAPLKDDNAACFGDFECKSSWCRSQQCAPMLARDATCTAIDRCNLYLTCRNGKCTDPVTVDPDCPAGCGFMERCVQGQCERVAVCTPGPAGERCAMVGCVETAYCNADSVCTAITQVNQPCITYGSGAECGPDAYCNRFYYPSICTRYAAIDDSCATRQCKQGEAYCDDANGQFCHALKADGADCINYWECQSYDCGSDGKCTRIPACAEG